MAVQSVRAYGGDLVIVQREASNLAQTPERPVVDNRNVVLVQVYVVQLPALKKSSQVRSRLSEIKGLTKYTKLILT